MSCEAVPNARASTRSSSAFDRIGPDIGRQLAIGSPAIQRSAGYGRRRRFPGPYAGGIFAQPEIRRACHPKAGTARTSRKADAATEVLIRVGVLRPPGGHGVAVRKSYSSALRPASRAL